MINVDFKTEEGKNEAQRIAREIFRDIGNMQIEFSTYETMTVIIDDVYVFKFPSAESLLQMKLFWRLAEIVLK